MGRAVSLWRLQGTPAPSAAPGGCRCPQTCDHVYSLPPRSCGLIPARRHMAFFPWRQTSELGSTLPQEGLVLTGSIRNDPISKQGRILGFRMDTTLPGAPAITNCIHHGGGLCLPGRKPLCLTLLPSTCLALAQPRWPDVPLSPWPGRFHAAP